MRTPDLSFTLPAADLPENKEFPKDTILALKKILGIIKEIIPSIEDSEFSSFLEAGSGSAPESELEYKRWGTEVCEGINKFAVRLEFYPDDKGEVDFRFLVGVVGEYNDLSFEVQFIGEENRWNLDCEYLKASGKDEILQGVERIYTLPEIEEIVEDHDINLEIDRPVVESKALRIIQAFSQLFEEKFKRNEKRSI